MSRPRVQSLIKLTYWTFSVGSYKADLYTYEKQGSQWKPGPVKCEVNLGVKGIANLNEKREGDKMTPAGYFPLPFAFGLKKDVDTKMEFRELNRNHVWVSDTLSNDYNLWIEDEGGVY
jgi:L,D-peptidoglycan transpeptidase YkuD (ErfK/YbiS/YcfS/YnhG family)